MEANLKKDSHVNSSAFQLIYKAPKFEMSHVYGSDSDKYRLSLSPYGKHFSKMFFLQKITTFWIDLITFFFKIANQKPSKLISVIANWLNI